MRLPTGHATTVMPPENRHDVLLLIESKSDDGTLYQYSSGGSATIISEWGGSIPPLSNGNLRVWRQLHDSILKALHKENSPKEPTGSYDTLVKEWATKEGLPHDDWDELTDRRLEFAIQHHDDQTPISTTLLTCLDGTHEIYQSVSEAYIESRSHEHDCERDNCTPILWTLCGEITEDIKHTSQNVYHQHYLNQGTLQQLLTKLTGTHRDPKNKTPVEIAPIDHTPFGLALHKLNVYDRDHFVTNDELS